MERSWILDHARTAVLVLATLVTLGATAVALWESYNGLYLWAAAHHAPYPHLWPLCVDTFVVLGESALFIGMVDHWRGWARAWPWMVTGGGLAVSVAANMGHAGAVILTDRLTFAVPPLAACIGLTVALGILKRVVSAAPGSSTAARSSPAAAAARSWSWSWSWPWLTITRAPGSPAAAAARSSTAARRSSTAAAARSSTAARRSSTAAAARSSTAAAKVAELVGQGTTDTKKLAAAANIAPRTARRYRSVAVTGSQPRLVEVEHVG